MYGLHQWEEALLCNASSHWLSPYPEWSLNNASIQEDIWPMAIVIYMINVMFHSDYFPSINTPGCLSAASLSQPQHLTNPAILWPDAMRQNAHQPDHTKAIPFVNRLSPTRTNHLVGSLSRQKFRDIILEFVWAYLLKSKNHITINM